MNINTVLLGLMVLAFGVHMTYAYFSISKPPPLLPGFLVPMDVNKARTFVNKTSDASMFIEATRRQAIIRNPDGVFSYKGSDNGSLEWNFLTSICVCPNPRYCPHTPQNVVWDDGGATDEICDVVDAGGATDEYELMDFGGAAGNVCDV